MTTAERKHVKRLERYTTELERLYVKAVNEAALAGASLPKFDKSKPFAFADHPAVDRRIQKAVKQLHDSFVKLMEDSISAEWGKGEDLVDNAVAGVLGDEFVVEHNRSGAAAAFVKRKENGMNLSQRVWKYVDQFKQEMEMGIDWGLRNGQSAAEMSRDLRKYLRDPNMLFRRVRDEHGNLHLSQRAKAYHPGQGVYRSSYKNAMRLARTEINMAYRAAGHDAAQDEDMIVGIEVHLSNNHNCLGIPNGEFYDICDVLAGKYPKDFKFVGWHPNCRCYPTFILMTDEELKARRKALLNGEEPPKIKSKNEVTDVPENFKKWLKTNKERAKGWSSMPYFARYNPKYVPDFEVDTYSSAERKFTRARRTSEAMRESAELYVQSLYPEIPTTEKAAIYHYTQGEKSTFRQLNKHLREGAHLNEFEVAFSELLSQALSKMEATQGTVYRTIRLNKTNLTKWQADAQEMRDTTFEAFSSTSRSVDIVMQQMEKGNRKKNETDILLIIEGRSGRYISDLSEFSGRKAEKYSQQEVLFDKGTKFHFEKVEKINNLWHFWLTEI